MIDKWGNYLFIAVLSGFLVYASRWGLCLSDVYSMSPEEYARQAQQLVECSLGAR